MYNPGRMNNKIDFYDKNSWEDNNLGESEQTPKKIFTEFAEIRTWNGKETIENGKIAGEVNYRIFMRFRNQVHEGLEIRWLNYMNNGKSPTTIADITAIIVKGRYMEIQAKEKVDLNG